MADVHLTLKIHWRAIIADVASGCSRTYLFPPLSSGGAARRNFHKEKRSKETHAAANDYLDKHLELIEEAAQRMREPAFAALPKARKLYPSGVPLTQCEGAGRGWLGPLAAAGDRGFRSPSPA